MNQRVPYPVQRGVVEWGGGGPHGGDTLEWVIFALLLLLIVLVVALLVLSVMRRGRFGGPRHRQFKMYGGPPGGGPPGGGRPWGRPDALEIARQRYAQGAIGRDEYVQLVQDLGGGADAPPPPPG
jgi:uncharacterized membrane protein